MASQLIRVRAIQRGYYGGVMRIPGAKDGSDRFHIKDEAAFSKIWMRKIKPKAIPKLGDPEIDGSIDPSEEARLIVINKIANAVERLDETDEEHWTVEGGLPAIDVIEAMIGEIGIQRGDVEEAAPGLVRPNFRDVNDETKDDLEDEDLTNDNDPLGLRTDANAENKEQAEVDPVKRAQEKKERVIKALHGLDHLNDQHWTKDGQPLMQVVERLGGFLASELSREEVVAAEPDFKRIVAGDEGGGAAAI